MHVDPARPQGRDPRPRHRQDQRRLRARRPEADARDGQAAARHPDQPRRQRDFGGFRRAVDRLGCVYVDVDRRYYHSNVGLAAGSSTRRSTSSPATRSSAARRRSTTCATATPTPTSSAPRASRTSCARPRSRSALGRLFGDRKELLTIFGELHATPTSARRRRSCGCSSSPSSRPRTRSSEVHFRGDETGAELRRRLAATQIAADGRRVPQRRGDASGARSGDEAASSDAQARARKKRSARPRRRRA